ncbi:MAG TPA: ClpXP protease specificity-enhancing factor [Rhodanobacteraceae bacterium]|nr:ClpXP protease specificity-enhancing factor [Rhodanobacteraceae bacterium]
MTSNRPYLLRALYDWIGDNGLTPYLLVDARVPTVRVPPGATKEGRVILNIASRAVTQLMLGPERVRFLARFGGVSQIVDIPIAAILAIYAQENGQGMMFPVDDAPPEPPDPPETSPPHSDESSRRPRLHVVK